MPLAGGQDSAPVVAVGGDGEPQLFGFLLGSDLGQERRLVTARPGQQPLIGMCDSARCPQATHHHRHRQVWADHADNIRTTFLGNPRLSRPGRARAQAAYDRAARVITEIDTAAPAAEDPEP